MSEIETQINELTRMACSVVPVSKSLYKEKLKVFLAIGVEELMGDNEVTDKNRVNKRNDCWGCYESDYCPHEIRDEFRDDIRIKLEALK